jgi:predicted DNA-binding protein with PD1-like motif
MKSKKIADDAGSETRIVVLDSGEEAFAALTKFANEVGITAASLTAIGAFEKATIGWFDFDKKTYKKIAIDQQCEVLSAIGDVAVGDDGKASLHVHVVLGLSDGTTRGGHLVAGMVRPTLEVVLTDTPTHLRRKKNADIGIALIASILPQAADRQCQKNRAILASSGGRRSWRWPGRRLPRVFSNILTPRNNRSKACETPSVNIRNRRSSVNRSLGRALRAKWSPSPITAKPATRAAGGWSDDGR